MSNTKRILECVPNFSEGIDLSIIKQITDEIELTDGVALLNVDPGKATNRTVVTFVGDPEQVIEAAFKAIKKASQLIDMTKHKGEHPRMGATDVCPLIPISGITMEEAANYSTKLAERVANELNIPVYLYEYSQPNTNRNNLSVIRNGEYEGFFEKIKLPEWKPDFGPTTMNAFSGATVIGARNFLIAYNINLNTTSTRIANRIAFDVRENGRPLREGNPFVGKVVLDSNGEEVRIPGSLKFVKAIGWYIEEYGIAQISMNLTNYKATPMHIAFDECVRKGMERGVRITGSELVGLIPLAAMLDAGKYFLNKQGLSTGCSESELIRIAVKSMGLDELGVFNPKEKIIEYLLEEENDSKLVNMKVTDFVDETASNSPAPGGGSISALSGSLGAALGTMVANLSAEKKGWEERVEEFSPWAEKGQEIKKKLVNLVDEDTRAFNKIMEAMKLPKATPEEIEMRKAEIEKANKYACEVPFMVMQVSAETLELLKFVSEHGNPNAISDAGVGTLCTQTAVKGAYYNIRVNAPGIKDQDFIASMLNRADELMTKVTNESNEILSVVEKKLGL